MMAIAPKREHPRGGYQKGSKSALDPTFDSKDLDTVSNFTDVSAEAAQARR